VGSNVTLTTGAQYRALSVHSPAWPVDRRRLSYPNGERVWVTDLLCHALDQLDTDHGPPWIIGGDFNSSETFDYLWPGGPHGNLEFLGRMQGLSLTECLRHKARHLVPTFRNPRDGKVIHQIDHLFVSKQLRAHLVSCKT